MLSNEFVQNIKEKTNLLDLVNESTDMHPAGYNIWQGRCPHQSHSDSSPSFTVFHNKDGSWSWCCYGCNEGRVDHSYGNYGSDCIAYVRWLSDYPGSKHKLNFREALEVLAKRLGLTMEEEKYQGNYDDNALMANVCHKVLDDRTKNYLYSRGLDDSDIKEWKIGYDCELENNEFVPRISFPLFERYNRIVGFSKRLMPYEKRKLPKYWNTPTRPWFHKRSYLYGIHKIDKDFKELRITEGQIDVILSSKYGVKNIVAPLGSAFTEEHADLIKKLGLTPVFCFDGDAAGRKGIEKAVKIMSEIGVYSKICLLPDSLDMADMANKYKDKLEEYIQLHSMSYWEYLLIDTCHLYNVAIEEARRRALPAIELAAKGAVVHEDKLLMKNFVKERFGIEI